MIYEIGSKVICVNNSNIQSKGSPKPLIKDCVYTIDGTSVNEDGAVGLLLRELRNPNILLPNGSEAGYRERRFVPVEILELNIEELLTATK